MKTLIYVDVTTRQPLSFYYDPVNHDTFDSRGRIVNNALVLTNGSYTIDETKIKSNKDAFKIKNDQIKLKMDNNDYEDERWRHKNKRQG